MLPCYTDSHKEIHNMKALKSNFYLIRVDEKPVYVGYTNRPTKTRFREHLHDKDFGDGEVTVEELDSLSFPFTWDINLINQYAKQVSDRETELIAEYNTDTSVWQKGIHGDIGGQVWNDVKHFVLTNKDNPKFRGMPDDIILELVEYQHKMIEYLKHVITNTQPLEDTRLRNVINGTKPLEDTRLKTVITGTKPLEDTRLKHVITHTQPLEDTRLKNVIRVTKPLEDTRLRNVITNTKPLEDTRLKSVINNTKPLEDTRLRGVINHTNPSEDTRLRNVIGGTKPLEDTRLRSVIRVTKSLEDTRLRSVIKVTKPLEDTRLKGVITNTRVDNKTTL